MVSRLLPEQIAANWDEIEEAISASMPNHILRSTENMNRILENLLLGKMDCWTIFDRDEDGTGELIATFTTVVVNDEVSMTRNLLIYSLFGYTQKIAEKYWAEALGVISTWAADNKCYKVIAYTNQQTVLSLVKRLGGRTDISCVEFNV